MTSSHTLRWYAVQTKPKQESRADANLRRWGLETLAPWLREPRRGASDAYSIVPLFPGYIFSRFDASILLAKVRLTRGVRGVIGFGEYATPVDDAIVEIVRSRLGADGFVRVAEPKPGDPVTIVDGPLRSLEGVFYSDLGGRDRVLILLTTLNAQVRVQVAKAFVRPTTLRVAS
jgi:transcriptional antiterminator RfaH